MAWIVDWQVRINGRDLSSRMRPFLTEIEVTDKEGMASDSCSLTFDDRGGHIKLPPKKSLVEVFLNGVMAFRGFSDAPRSSGARGGGRLLKVGAKGFDTSGKAKAQQSFHKDDATLGEFLKDVADRAGFSIKVDPAFDVIRRDYWSVDGESLLAFGQRMARELHATFKLRGTEAVLVPRGADSPLAPVIAIAGENGNVINWDIEPFSGRAAFARAKVRYFDRAKARFEEKDIEIDDAETDAEQVTRTLAADGDQAETIAKGRKSEAEREAGGGSIEMDLVAHARAEAPLTLSGARRGVDGTYRITSVTTRANRSGGATTRCDVKQPGGGAGKDDRKTRSPNGGGDETGADGDVTLPRDPELG